MIRMTLVAASCTAAAIAAAASAQTALRVGPSTTSTPYVTGVAGSPVREVVSILTVGDTINGYRMLGIPDGLGAFMSGDVMKLSMNHEFTSSAASGQHAFQSGSTTGGSFVSLWTIDPATLQVLNGTDAMQSVMTTTNGTGGSLTKLARFCSGDVAATSAYFNPATGLGTTDHIHIAGEESGTPGRMIATDIETGVGYQLTPFDSCNGAWENGVARPMASDTTLVIGTSDGGSNRVFMYLGTKQASGNAIERAGLMNGAAYGVQVKVNGNNFATETIAGCFASTAPAVYSARFGFGAAGDAGTTFLRPEDGAWDPMNPRDFYFVTTNVMSKTSAGAPQAHASRLFRMRFDNVNDPLAGGVIEALLTGDEGMEMADNICVFNTIQGGTRVLLQEDPGAHPQNAKIWCYDVATDTLQLLLRSDTARFGDYGVAATAPFTTDEENSGVIDARDTLGLGWFISVMQAHYTVAAPMIEGGQLYAFFSPQLVGSCDEDLSLTLDAKIDGEDISIALLNWGGPGRTDVNGDGTTDIGDIAALLLSWGDCTQ